MLLLCKAEGGSEPRPWGQRFQDRRDRPLCQLSGAKLIEFFIRKKWFFLLNFYCAKEDWRIKLFYITPSCVLIMKEEGLKNPFNLLVIVASLGYFVDIYDLILFNVVKKESLEALGLGGVGHEGTKFFLLIVRWLECSGGGILWEFLGEIRRGGCPFCSDLFFCILLQILLECIWIGDMTSYATVMIHCRSWSWPVNWEQVSHWLLKRWVLRHAIWNHANCYFGALGAVFASIVGKEGHFANYLNEHLGTHLVGWQMAYIVGGVLGLFLLLLRLGTIGSGCINV